MTKGNYRVSVNGYSTYYVTKDEAMKAAQHAKDIDADMSVRVYDMRFNNLVFEN